MPALSTPEPSTPGPSNNETLPARESLIGAVKTYLGFFVLIALIVEAVLGAVALNTQGQNQLFAMGAMLAIIVLLVAIISFFAYVKPDALLRTQYNSPEDSSALNTVALHTFCNQLAGYWWESIKPEKSSALSFVEISLDSATNSIKMKGKAYSATGELAAIWETVASCINVGEHKVFYYWKGWHPTRSHEPYEGFGEISFHASNSIVDNGFGIFSDTNLIDVKSTIKKTAELRRATPEEIVLMAGGDNKAIIGLLEKKLSAM